MTRRYEPIEERFAKYVDDSGECWVWTGANNNLGYGYIRLPYRGKLVQADRWLWTYCFGDLPEDGVLCHTCDNPTCVNPSHLYVGTQQSNMLDKEERQRGNHNGPRKLSDMNISDINRLYALGTHVKYIARQYNISSSTVYSHIKRSNNEKN